MNTAARSSLLTKSALASALVFAVLGLAILPSSVRGGDRSMTLAMVNYDSLIAPEFPAFTAISPAAPSQFLPIENSVDHITSLVSGKDSYSVALFPAREFQSGAVNSLWLIRPALRTDSLLKMWGGLEAGYGQLFSDKTAAVYGRHGTAWEEPGVGYLKFSFRF